MTVSKEKSARRYSTRGHGSELSYRDPNTVKRQDVKAVVEHIGSVARVKSDTCDERFARCPANPVERTHLLPEHSPRGFHFESNDASVVSFDYQVDLVPVVSSPVPPPSYAIKPRNLLEQFTDREGLKKVAELGEGCRVEPRKLLWS